MSFKSPRPSTVKVTRSSFFFRPRPPPLVSAGGFSPPTLSHPVGAVLGTHHGLTNAVFMPYVMVFNRPVIEQKAARLAAYLGFADPSFEALLEWILDLRRRFDIPETAAELGVTSDRLESLAKMAAADPTAAGNPVPVGAAELKALYEAALAGGL